jgi:TorA maturation chaperone TorD
MAKRKKEEKTPQEELRARLVDIHFNEKLTAKKDLPPLKELMEMAEEVKKTFRNEHSSQHEPCF